MGNRVYKKSVVSGSSTERKYIVDISGKLPTILCELDTSGSLKKSYVYTPNSQILYQRDHTKASGSDEFFYVHDRLGSVRLVVDESETTKNSYTYDPTGIDFATEVVENTDNAFKFTGQWYDDEISQYYLRARMYDPELMRFTGYDPVRGKFGDPLTLHRYLYCLNDPMNRIDLDGRCATIAFRLLSGAVGSVIAGGVAAATQQDKVAIGAAMVSGFIGGFSMNMWVSAGMGGFSSGFSTWMAGGGVEDILQNTVMGMGIGLAGGSVAARFTGGLGEEMSKAVTSWSAVGGSSLGMFNSGVLQLLHDAGYLLTEKWTEDFWKSDRDRMREQLYGPQP